jgi:hypothetical protein
MAAVANVVANPLYYDFTEEISVCVKEIESIMKITKFPRRSNKNNYKKSTGYGRSEAFGFIRKRNRCPGPSRNNKLYPDLWKALQKLGSLLPISYDAVQVNFNCVCMAHRDEGNEGLSFLCSGGDYEGGELITELGTYNAKYRGIIFDGSKITHSNNEFRALDTTPLVKWTLVFFSVIIPPFKQHFFPTGFRQTYPYYRDRFLETLPERETLYFPNGINKNKKNVLLENGL